jgi:succinate dehydrogenase / fumarate reductase flavoprotein subunit/fumarate reductase (CoM/CoB) subunit A
MLLVARVVAEAALLRAESRGAHQREDYAVTLSQWQVHQRARLAGGGLSISGAPVVDKALAS